jgi:GTPase
MSGSTMTTSHHVIGFDSSGKLINQQNVISLEKWFDQVNKLLSFIDVGGHKKAEKQLVSSLCSFFP